MVYYGKKVVISINRSFEFYKEFCDFVNNESSLRPDNAHQSLFKPTGMNEKYIKNLYEETYYEDKLPNRPNDSNCKRCISFNLKEGVTYNKKNDIKFGNVIEDVFKEFLESKFNALSNTELHIICARADTEKKNMPDFKIIRKSDGKTLFYFEFKAIFRPYIFVKENVSTDYNCYSHSLTLDYSNGKKLETQKKLVEDLGLENVFYVYWYDLPCVKGIFWMNSNDVYSYIDEGMMYERKSQSGDYNNNLEKYSATKKIYLPLNKMHDFHKFYDLIKFKLKKQ